MVKMTNNNYLNYYIILIVRGGMNDDKKNLYFIINISTFAQRKTQ